jgi:hypothetical protein
MKIEDYKGKIALFTESNPHLTLEELAVCLTADLLYKDLPSGLAEFRTKFAHLDPDMISTSSEGITFLRIAEETQTDQVAMKRLNDYMNLKFHDINSSRDYRVNAQIFREKSIIVSRVVEEILARAVFPPEIMDVLREREEVRSCTDFYEMLQLYRRTSDDRLRFEMLRKIGLIVLIARINRTVWLEELERRKQEIRKVFLKRLRCDREEKQEYYLWLNVKHKVEFSTSRDQARESYEKEMENRRRQACRIFPLQRFVCNPFTTFSGVRILHMEIRNKFGDTDTGTHSYTSYVEKMLRKNLEFPNQVHDTIGVKIVVEEEGRIEHIIRDLETFLGGSSTRKMQKNSYHRFGRRKISEYSSPEYFVWKAVYDIALPHPSVSYIKKLRKLTQDNPLVQKELKSRMQYFVRRPSDFVIEVQLQDIKSYLLSIAEGSPTAHAWLKTNQVRSNTFYKVFPAEIYEGDIRELKMRLLGQRKEPPTPGKE